MAEDSPASASPPPTFRGSTAVGIVALLGLVALLAALDELVAVDDAVWRAVLLMRSCVTDVIIDRTVELATRIMMVLFAVVILRHARDHGVRSLWPWLSTCGLGLLAGKTLKHVFARERPSSLPDALVGYSFPSAHVMNTIVALLAVMALTQGFRRRKLWSLVAGALTMTVTVGRVLLGHHWVSDAVGGGLAALALVGLGVPAVIRRPAIAPATLALVLMGVLGIDERLGDEGLRLPTPLVGHHAALIDVDVGASLLPYLVGAWREAADEPPAGSLVWFEGNGTVPIEIPQAMLESGSDVAGAMRLAFGGRTEKVLSSCATVSADLNGRTLLRVVPFGGWREYRLPIPPGLLRPGRNELVLSAETREEPARFAVAYVRIAESLSAK